MIELLILKWEGSGGWCESLWLTHRVFFFALFLKSSLPVMEFITIIVRGHNIKEENIFGFGVEPRHSEFHLGKHLAGKRKKNPHLEKIPRFINIYTDTNTSKLGKC